MTGYFISNAGRKWQLPELLSWDVCHGSGEPCDYFELSFLYDADMLEMLDSATRFRGIFAGETVFYGVVDEYRVCIDLNGAVATVSGRSLAALLLDNEAPAADYACLSLGTVLGTHVRSCGVTDIRACDMPPLSSFTVSSGESEWSVLKRFCTYSAGIFPRFSKDGVLVLADESGKHLDIDDTVPLTKLVRSYDRDGIISEIEVKNKSSFTSCTVRNVNYVNPNGCGKRILNVPRSTGADAMRYTGEYQIAQSMKGRDYIELTLPELFAAFPADTVTLINGSLGISRTLTVTQTRCWADPDGAGTVIRLEAL